MVRKKTYPLAYTMVITMYFSVINVYSVSLSSSECGIGTGAKSAIYDAANKYKWTFALGQEQPAITKEPINKSKSQTRKERKSIYI